MEQQQKAKKDKTLIQTQTTTNIAAQSVAADDFDKYDSKDSVEKQTAKVKAGLLDQGKVLADTLDSSSRHAVVAVPAPAPVPVVVQVQAATPPQVQNIQVDEGLAADNKITTDELEQQAQALVKQASQVLGTPANDQQVQQPEQQQPQDAQN